MTGCGCHPGTEASGWHEVRSPECVRQEFEEWTRVIRAAHELGRAVAEMGDGWLAVARLARTMPID